MGHVIQEGRFRFVRVLCSHQGIRQGVPLRPVLPDRLGDIAVITPQGLLSVLIGHHRAAEAGVHLTAIGMDPQVYTLGQFP